MSTQPDNPVHRPTAQPTASRYRRAAWAPLVSGAHRPANRITPTPGESFGLAGPPGNGLTLVGIHYAAGPASSLYVSCGPCSSVPASGCHHRAVPDDPTGLPEQALNLLLLVVSPSGTRKTMTKSHALRSQAVAPTTWNPAARTIPLCPFIIRRQSSTANRLTRRKGAAFPMTTALPPPTCCRPPPRCIRPPEPPS